MALPPDATLADVGEFGLIAALTDLFPQGEHVLIGPGDDAAVLRVRTGHVVVSTDLMVEGRHFRRDWACAEDVGHRAAAQNLSDINAMGGRATSLTVGLAAPADLPAAWALDFARGFADECALVGASVVGGDLTRAEQVVIAVTVIGACTTAPVVRSGAEAGDVLALFGRQGWAAGGLAVLGRGFRSPRVLVEAYRRPEPPYDAGRVAAEAGATAMIDVSDGLLADAGHLAEGSAVSIDVRSDAFEIPEPLQAVGAALGADPMQFVLGGGDDHALLATFPDAASVPAGWQVIGAVVAARRGRPRRHRGRGVVRRAHRVDPLLRRRRGEPSTYVVTSPVSIVTPPLAKCFRSTAVALPSGLAMASWNACSSGKTRVATRYSAGVAARGVGAGTQGGEAAQPRQPRGQRRVHGGVVVVEGGGVLGTVVEDGQLVGHARTLAPRPRRRQHPPRPRTHEDPAASGDRVLDDAVVRQLSG